MRVAIPASVRSAVDPLALMIAAFCLLWSSAFAVAKLALADCPPLPCSPRVSCLQVG